MAYPQCKAFKIWSTAYKVKGHGLHSEDRRNISCVRLPDLGSMVVSTIRLPNPSLI